MYGSFTNKNILILKHIYNIANNKLYDSFIPDNNRNIDSVKYFIDLLSIRQKSINDIVPLNDNIDPVDIDTYISNLKNSSNILDNIPKSKLSIKSDIPIDDKYLFGTAETDYTAGELHRLIRSGLLDDAKTYVRKYFAKIANPPGVLFWKHYDKSMIHYTIDEIKNLFIHKITNGEFEIQSWFTYAEMTLYFREMSITKGRIYKIGNQMCINSFPGFLHTQMKKFSNYPIDIQKKVELIWDHIKIVWCSGKKELFDYNKNWICCMVSGRKMTTCIYLKSIQGTGKTVITEFLQSKVLGHKIVYITSNSDCLYSFNHQIYGKLLLVFEELPSMNKSLWCLVGNSLKHFITGKTYTHKEKMKTDFETTNNFSIILSSNNNAIKIEADDRRTVVNDVSHEKVGDFQYFDKLFEATNNDLVGEAFYWYCLEYSNNNTNFKEYPPPFSETKKDLIVENLHSLFIYIKEIFIKNQDDIDMPFADFYDNYTQYLVQNKFKIISKISVSKLLVSHQLGLINGNQNIRLVRISAKCLYKIYNSKKWIHDIDDIHHLYES